MLHLCDSYDEAKKLAEKLYILYTDRYLGTIKYGNSKMSITDCWYKLISDLIFEAPLTLLVENHIVSKSNNTKTFKYNIEYDLGKIN